MLEFGLVRTEITLILDLSAVTFALPVALICKNIFAQKTARRYFVTVSDILDICIFLAVCYLWSVVQAYDHSEVSEELFGPEEDSRSEIKFVASVIYDIVNDIFHLDYLLAAVTALLWMRCIILLRLTETFGPMLVMIYRMMVIVLTFLFIYFLGILTLSCIATLTLNSNPNFMNLFEALRTYIAASLGSFDLYQYDSDEGWKRYYGIALHLVVLFSNMILMINLLIAIMSDTYAELATLKKGLYWHSVILEMPKFAYDKHYGPLGMFPFPFVWMSLLFLPVAVFVKDKKLLEKISKVCFLIAFCPLAIVILAYFMAVNLILLPFAYVKTIVHKAFLLNSYRGANHCQSLATWVLLGVPLLLVA